MGGGSLPFYGPEGFAALAAKMTQGKAITNNLYSSDMTAFPASDAALGAAERCSRDNALARALHDAGLAVEALPRTLATQFDIDTPPDVAVLALAAEYRVLTVTPGPRLAAYASSAGAGRDRYRAVLPLFLDPAKEVLVAGRVGSHAWSYLESETACRVRLFAEERGMEAEGRAAAGTARSLLAYYLEAVGCEHFFATLGEMCDAAFIDSRVVLAHKGLSPSRKDRFLSDLGRPQDTADAFLREVTRAALAAPVPVLLGGHSLVSGTLMALNELAWSLRDAGRL
jgi:hypothetical protein